MKDSKRSDKERGRANGENRNENAVVDT